MRERAARIGGKLTLVSSANSGTEITLVIPGGIVFQKGSRTSFERMKAFLRGWGERPTLSSCSLSHHEKQLTLQKNLG
jgi:hypothetical protein